MSLRSMTGFARKEGQHEGTTWAWEIRAVNGKGLDIRLRLSSGFEHLDPSIRKTCGAKIARGNVQIVLTAQSATGQSMPVVNENVLAAVNTALKQVSDQTGAAMPDAAQILALRGVMEFSDASARGSDEELQENVLSGLDSALDALVNHRQEEGTQLATFLNDQIDQIESLSRKATDDPARKEAAITDRIKAQVARLGDFGTGIDPDRLTTEVALLATKADIQEELDRLNAHVASARTLLAEGSPVGRKLEFLAQEFNREANTLCSKSNAVSITETGLAMKVVVDQFREQVLNVE